MQELHFLSTALCFYVEMGMTQTLSFKVCQTFEHKSSQRKIYTCSIKMFTCVMGNVCVFNFQVCDLFCLDMCSGIKKKIKQDNRRFSHKNCVRLHGPLFTPMSMQTRFGNLWHQHSELKVLNIFSPFLTLKFINIAS